MEIIKGPSLNNPINELESDALHFYRSLSHSDEKPNAVSWQIFTNNFAVETHPRVYELNGQYYGRKSVLEIEYSGSVEILRQHVIGWGSVRRLAGFNNKWLMSHSTQYDDNRFSVVRLELLEEEIRQKHYPKARKRRNAKLALGRPDYNEVATEDDIAAWSWLLSFQKFVKFGYEYKE